MKIGKKDKTGKDIEEGQLIRRWKDGQPTFRVMKVDKDTAKIMEKTNVFEYEIIE